jgi:Domain of unknown function (DUF4350)
MDVATRDAGMNRRAWLIGLALLVPLAAFVAWWLDTFERAEEEVSAPLRGEASYNPFYGLQKVLQARGIDVESRSDLNLSAMDLGPRDTLVLGADVRTLSSDQASDLLDWIDTGGQLIFSLPQGDEGRGGELLDALGMTVVSRFACLRWPADASGEKAMQCSTFAFQLKTGEAKKFQVLVGDEKNGYVMGRRTREDGAWFVAASLHFLANRELNEDGDAALAWQVLAPALRGGKVHLVYAVDIAPLYVLLVEKGWPALIPALLALLAWLWARSQRFGPLLPLAAKHRRALSEHVQAAGEFTFRRGRGLALYAPLRRAFDESLRRDEPELAALDGEAQVAALAARSGRSPAEVRQALNPVDLARPEQFFATIRTLTELRARP